MDRQDLASAIASHQAGRLSDAEAVYLSCLARDAADRDATFYLAGLRLQQGRGEEAETLLRRLLAIRPDDAPAWMQLGLAARSRGAFADALPCLERAVHLQDASPAAHYNLGVVLALLGRTQEALLSFERAVLLKPHYALAHSNRGAALARLGRWADAVASCERALSLNPSLVDAHANRGAALIELGLLSEAIESLQRTLVLAPEHVDAWLGRGNALQRLGRLEEAEANWRQALAQNANAKVSDPKARAKYLNNLGTTLLDQGRVAEAGVIFGEALATAPDFSDAQSNLLLSFDQAGNLDAMAQGLADAVVRFPDNAELHARYGRVLCDTGRTAEALVAYRRAVMLEPENLSRRSAMIITILYLPEPCALDFHTELEAFDRAARAQSGREGPERVTVPAGPHATQQFAHPRSPSGRLRIGYVSADLRLHSVAYFLEPVLESHDRGSVEIFCYHCAPQEDEVTSRIKVQCEHWRACSSLPDKDLARLIESDSIDVLIDLSGHTAGNRLGVFARRPAPIQLSWLGFPGDTGLGSIDGYIGDALVAPQGAKVIRLAPTFSCYRPSRHAPAVAPAPMMKNGYVTFGSFNNLVKLSEPAVALWSRILREIDGSRLILKHQALKGEQTARRVKSRFAMHGVEAERLHILPWDASLDAHFGHYDLVDIGLDPFPYCGVTTTCEALWMGVPVISLVGDRFAGRTGLSLLSAIGHPEWAVATEDDYVNQVKALCSSPSTLARLRSTLRDHVAVSPLTDARAFTSALESALIALNSGVRPRRD